MIEINLIRDSKFFIPTPRLKELIILEYIENKPDVTQKELAQVANAAPSMINAYIDEYEKKGYLKREYISKRDVNYLITPKGIQRKNYLMITYLRELLDLYHLEKRNIENYIESLIDRGYRNVLLYGAGEVAETILGVVRDRETDLNVIAVIDDDNEKQGKEILGYKIISLDEINNYPHHGIIITTYTFEDVIMEKLKSIGYDMSKVIRFFWMGDLKEK